MEVLRILEEKVMLLIQSKKEDLATVAHFKEENARLEEENRQLVEKVNMLEEAFLSQNKNSEKLDEERGMTELVVGELIQQIDGALEKELQV